MTFNAELSQIYSSPNQLLSRRGPRGPGYETRLIDPSFPQKGNPSFRFKRCGAG